MNSGDGSNPETETDILDSCADIHNPSTGKKGLGWFWTVFSTLKLKLSGYFSANNEKP